MNTKTTRRRRSLWERMNDPKYDGVWDLVVLPTVIVLLVANVSLWGKKDRAPTTER